MVCIPTLYSYEVGQKTIFSRQDKIIWSISGIYRASTCSTSLLYFLLSKQEDVDDFHFLFEDWVFISSFKEK